MTIQRVTVDAVTWTAISAPFSCNGLTIQDAAGTTAIKVRTNSSDSTTELTIPAGIQANIEVDPITIGIKPSANFIKSGTAFYLQSGTGTITVVVTYI
jgi:hypothetical protein